MKQRIIIILALMWMGVSGAVAQQPTATFDGNKLSILVPEGYFELERGKVVNAALQDCIKWDGETAFFMSQPEPYQLFPQGLSTDEPLQIDGLFNGEPITLQVEMKEPAKQKPVDPDGGEASKKNLFLYGGLGLLVLVLLALVFILLRKKKTKVEPEKPFDPSVISVITDESVQYAHGLQHVKDHLSDYLVFDMDMVYADTALNKVYFSTALIKKLYDFFNNSLEADGRTNETGCFILGCWDQEPGSDRYDISLEYMVEPGDDADFGEYSLNFGKKISINMASVIANLGEKSKRDYVLTCWMHSHPGLGLFLSNQDLIVQKQLTYSDHRDRLLALVIDTNTPDLKLGFFTAKTHGQMNNKEEVKRWFSFEEISRQARELNRNHAVKEDLLSEFVADTDYFTLDLNDAQLPHLGLAAHAINQIDSTLYSCNDGIVGYFFGEEENGYVKIGCCLPYENEERVGCLLYGDGLNEAKLAAYASDLAHCRFFLNCGSGDKVQVWTRQDGTFRPVCDTTLTQMKEWIRRKRV